MGYIYNPNPRKMDKYFKIKRFLSHNDVKADRVEVDSPEWSDHLVGKDDEHNTPSAHYAVVEVQYFKLSPFHKTPTPIKVAGLVNKSIFKYPSQDVEYNLNEYYIEEEYQSPEDDDIPTE